MPSQGAVSTQADPQSAKWARREVVSRVTVGHHGLSPASLRPLSGLWEFQLLEVGMVAVPAHREVVERQRLRPLALDRVEGQGKAFHLVQGLAGIRSVVEHGPAPVDPASGVGTLGPGDAGGVEHDTGPGQSGQIIFGNDYSHH